MKKATYLLILIFLGCKSDNHIGSWIQSDNLINPMLLDIYEDSMSSNAYWDNNRLYNLKKDTVFFQSMDGIYKLLLHVDGDTLIMSDIENDSNFIKYEKNIYNNLIELYNKKLDTDIDLPRIKSASEIIFHNCNVFLLDYDHDKKLCTYYNGKIYILDSTSYLNLLPTEAAMDYFEDFLIIADRLIRYEDIKNIKKELGKGQRFKLHYLTSETGKKMYGIKAYATIYRGHYPDSLNIELLLPPLPDMNLTDFAKFKSLVGFFPSRTEYNGHEISSNDLKDSLKTNILTIDNFICVSYYDNNLTYEEFLKSYIDLIDVYDETRNDYSLDKFSKAYNELDDSTMHIVKHTLMRRISEIENEKYEEIKNKL